LPDFTIEDLASAFDDKRSKHLGEVREANLLGWLADDRTPRKLLEGTVFGKIVWAKHHGRSAGPSLASGFRIQHEAARIDATSTGKGFVAPGGWETIDDVISYDLDDDSSGNYQVGFGCQVVPIRSNRVSVEFATDVGWSSIEAAILGGEVNLEIRPSSQVFDPGRELIRLADFVVDS
jgi:hypothetical protein